MEKIEINRLSEQMGYKKTGFEKDWLISRETIEKHLSGVNVGGME